MRQREQNLLEAILGRPALDQSRPEAQSSQSAYAEAEREEGRLARPLHNAAPPPVALQKETPAHRIILLLRAKGLSVRDIYAHLGGQFDGGKPKSGTGLFSYQHLLTIVRQPWFKRQLVEILEESGLDQVRAIFESEVVPSIEELVRLRDEAKSEAVRLNACQSIIDRICGKPTQVVESSTTHRYERVPTEAEELDKELERMEKMISGGIN
jgi:hypothetical protein